MKTLLAVITMMFCAIAAYADVADDYTWHTNDSSQIVLDSYIGTNTVVVTPDEIDGLPVVDLGGIFNINHDITEVTVGANVTNLYNFMNCFALTSITVPASVISLGESCFYGASSLHTVTLSEGLTTIGNSAFIGCSSLTNITLPSSLTGIGAYCFADCSLSTIVLPPGLASCSLSGLFTLTNLDARGCTNLASLDAESGHGWKTAYVDADTSQYAVDTLLGSYWRIAGACNWSGQYTWHTNESNQVVIDSYIGTSPSVAMPDEIDGLPVVDFGWTFHYNPVALDITIGTNVTRIQNEAFGGSVATNLVVPPSVTVLEDGACEWSGLRRVYLSEGLISIGAGAFQISGLENLEIPSTVISLGDDLCYNCQNLTNITFKDCYANVPSRLAPNDWQLRTVSLGSHITYIEESAFASMAEYVESIYIPDSVSYMENKAFQGSGVRSVRLPRYLYSWPSQLFDGCYNLTSVVLPDNISTIPLNSFSGDLNWGFNLTFPPVGQVQEGTTYGMPDGLTGTLRPDTGSSGNGINGSSILGMP